MKYYPKIQKMKRFKKFLKISKNNILACFWGVKKMLKIGLFCVKIIKIEFLIFEFLLFTGLKH